MPHRAEPPAARPPPPRQQRGDPLAAPLGEAFGGGLLGRALGGLVAGAARGLGEQMEAAARATRGTYEDAAALLRSDPAVAARLGGGPVAVGPPVSQSSSSSSVNGRVTKRVALVVPVSSEASGRVATAQIVSIEEPGGRGSGGGAARLEITLLLPGGETLRVGGGGSGGGRGGSGGYGGGGDAPVIDAEFTEIK